MQFSLVISHYNITFSLFRLSQGSVATLMRRDWLSSYRHMYRSSLNLTVKLHLNLLMFHEVTNKNKLAPFYGSACILYLHYKHLL